MSNEPTDTDKNSSAAPGLAEALARLNKAISDLEASVDVSVKAINEPLSSDEQVQRMADDRAKLGRELDAAEARSVRLSQTNSEVSRRLVGAMEMVRSVLDNKQ